MMIEQQRKLITKNVAFPYFLIATFLMFFVSQPVSAECYFGCDSISRNLSTDYAKLISEFKDSGYKEDKNNSNILCNINNKNELEIISVRKKSDEDVLVVVYSQFTPPKTVGDSAWKKMNASMWNVTKIMKTLNFGISGIANNLSEDQRCFGGLATGSDTEISTGIVTCVYGNHEDLPVTLKRAKHEMDFEEIVAVLTPASNCE